MTFNRILKSTWYVISVLLITFLVLSTLIKFTRFLIQTYYNDPFQKTSNPYIIKNKSLTLNKSFLSENFKKINYSQEKIYFIIEHSNNFSCILAQGHIIEKKDKILLMKSQNRIAFSRLFHFSKLYKKSLSLSIEERISEKQSICSEWIGIENN